MQRNTKNTVLAAVIVAPILVLIFAAAYNRESFDSYTSGGGRYEVSPDGVYEASAMNMTDKIDGKITHYYEFEVLRMADRYSLAKKIIPDDDLVMFRQGNGRIYWEEDSQRVRFGTEDRTIWDFAITEP